ARQVIQDAIAANALRQDCRSTVLGIERRSTCGSADRVPCLLRRESGRHPLRGKITRPTPCAASATVKPTACPAATHWPGAADSNGDGLIEPPDDLRCVTRTTVDVPSTAAPAHTPGSPGVTVTNPKLLTQLGNASFSLNNARYTRFRSQRPGHAPDAILILVP